MERYLFTKDVLPVGFSFPQSFLSFVAQDPLPDLEPWVLLCTSKRYADGRLSAVKRLYPARRLVPFAFWDGSDDVACFDASITSEDPIVYYVHTYASPGWEDRGHVANFDTWLKAAVEESARYKADRAEK